MLKRPLRCLPLLNKMAWLRNFRAVWLLFLRTVFCSQEQKSSENGFGKRGFFFCSPCFPKQFSRTATKQRFFFGFGKGDQIYEKDGVGGYIVSFSTCKREG